MAVNQPEMEREYVENMFILLEPRWGGTKWMKEWKNREEGKDRKQRELDVKFFDRCHYMSFGEARDLIHQGATNDYVSKYYIGLTGYIWLLSNSSLVAKTLVAKIDEYFPEEREKAIAVLTVKQETNTTALFIRLTKRIGNQVWLTEWKERVATKDQESRLKDAKLYCSCDYIRGKMDGWYSAIWFIQEGASNDFANLYGQTALYQAASYGAWSIVNQIIDRFPNELERKTQNMDSILGGALIGKQYSIHKILIDMSSRTGAYPVADLLAYGVDRESVKRGVNLIQKRGNFQKQVEKDFKFIKEAGLDNDARIKLNMGYFISRCAKKPTKLSKFRCFSSIETGSIDVQKIISDTFGQTYFSSEPLVWHYKTRLSFQFIFEYFKRKQITGEVLLQIQNKKVKVIHNTGHTWIDNMEKDLSAFLVNKILEIQHFNLFPKQIKLELTKVLGQGGESIVLEKTVNFRLGSKVCAIKIVPIKRDAKRIQAKTTSSIFGVKTTPIIDSTEAYGEDKPNELTAKDLTHPNIIAFLDTGYEVIDDEVYHLTGKTKNSNLITTSVF